MTLTMKLFTPTNIAEKLTDAKANNNNAIEAIKAFLKQTPPENRFNFDLLNSEDIYSIDTIKDICIDYRLRFLDIKYFKNDLPKEAFDKIAAIERNHATTLSGFKIMAPSKLFRLKNTDDPLLFVPLGNNYYYLIHQWGDDLHPFRKYLMWPFKNIWNLLLLILVISWFVTLMTPIGLFTKSADWSSFWMLYFFMFKAIAAVVLYFGFALGKNFNPAIWNSKYNKS